MNHRPINVLSLFGGIECALVAIKKLRIPVANYYSSEIDKYAIQTAKKNHPEILHLGDVKGLKHDENWEYNDILTNGIDLLIGGSPCQDLSIAKANRKGLDGDISIIDWTTVNLSGGKNINSDTFLSDPSDEDDNAPEAPFEAQTVEGDLYELGDHRILCGDSTKHTDLKKLMGTNKADVVFTDPPYNVDYKGSGENTKNGIMNDKMDDDKFLAFLKDTFLMMKGNIKEEAGCYVFHSHKTMGQFEEALKHNNFNVITQLIWNKPSAGLGMNHFRTKHEPFYYCSLSKDPVFYGDRTNTTVWEVPLTLEKKLKWFEKFIQKSEEGETTIWTMKRANVAEYVHPTQKPVELPVKALVNSSRKGDIVLDLFLGSGSTVIAAEKIGRKCYGMELDPRYVDVVVERWLQFTKQTTVIKNGKEITWQSNRVIIKDTPQPTA